MEQFFHQVPTLQLSEIAKMAERRALLALLDFGESDAGDIVEFISSGTINAPDCTLSYSFFMCSLF
jgi:hypothetical protein